MQTVETSLHTAAFDPITGAGLLALPKVEDMGITLGMSNLGEVDYNAMLKELAARGVRLAEGEDGLPWLEVGRTASGASVLALEYLEPIASTVEPSEHTAAMRELATMLGVSLTK